MVSLSRDVLFLTLPSPSRGHEGVVISGRKVVESAKNSGLPLLTRRVTFSVVGMPRQRGVVKVGAGLSSIAFLVFSNIEL